MTPRLGPRAALIEINTWRRSLRYRISTCECETAWWLAARRMDMEMLR
jgi:hypothetical protein